MPIADNPQFNYILGLDLGISSVGWACVLCSPDETELKGILAQGVRIFEKAEVPKTGESLALARRLARGLRRRLHRRKQRIHNVIDCLVNHQVLSDQDLDETGNIPSSPMTWFDPKTKQVFTEKPRTPVISVGIWGWRVLALDQKLSPIEWANVIRHIIKNRGYQSQRKNQINLLADADQTGSKDADEEKVILKHIADNRRALKEGGYRTSAELAVKCFAPEGAIRNHAGSYQHTFGRPDLAEELKTLFHKQRELGNPHTQEALLEDLLAILMYQKPALSGDALLKMVGYCTYEPEHRRAPKASYSAEYFMALSKLFNLRVLHHGKERVLTTAERQQCMDYIHDHPSLTFLQLRKLLKIEDDAFFNMVRIKPAKKKGAKDNLDPEALQKESDSEQKKAEKKVFIEMPFYHKVRLALNETQWALFKSQPHLINRIAEAFALYKEESEIQAYLAHEPQFDQALISALLAKITTDKFINLSIECLSKILPLMNQGQRYDEACREVYGTDINTHEATRLLPVIPADDIRNPVVFRALSQARKVINAIIRRYGAPMRVHIETARELSKSFQERREIIKNQEANQAEREAVRQLMQDTLGISDPKSKDILKFRLYQLQHGKCLYSGKDIDIRRLTEQGYVEIDHALPYSKSWDDSFNNKVLVLSKENQNKGNKTPYEFLKDTSQYAGFVARVQSSGYSKRKKNQLLMTEISDGFISRNLNDTRYITSYFLNFLQDHLALVGKGKNRIVATNGQLTYHLRCRWGINQDKTRENHRHHAMDAIVVACTTRSMQQRISHYHQETENLEYKGDRKLYCPEPWEHFRKEVITRVLEPAPELVMSQQLPERLQFYTECGIEILPLFVSRAPTRTGRGQGHLETVYSPKLLDQGQLVKRVPLSSLKLADIPRICGYEYQREPQFYKDLEDRLIKHDNKPEKAFETPFYKYSKNGQQKSLVRTVKLTEAGKSGILINNEKGLVKNATMVRIDIFATQVTKGKNKGKNAYYAVPVYASQIAKKEIPYKAVVYGKSEAEWLDIRDPNVYQFCFSLYPNDLVELTKESGEVVLAYYKGFDRAIIRISVQNHDELGTISRHSITTGIHSFKKLTVDVLGQEIHAVKAEKRPSYPPIEEES